MRSAICLSSVEASTDPQGREGHDGWMVAAQLDQAGVVDLAVTGVTRQRRVQLEPLGNRARKVKPREGVEPTTHGLQTGRDPVDPPPIRVTAPEQVGFPQ